MNSKLHPYRGGMSAIDKVEATDKDTVVLRLRHPQVSLITSLGNFAGAILPKHIWEGKDVARDPHNRQPIGTGPYKLVEYVRVTTSSTRRTRSTSCPASRCSTS